MPVDNPSSVHIVSRLKAEVGEGPLWDAKKRRLWWVDLLAGMIHCSDIISGETTTLATGGPVGAVVLRDSGGLVAADRTGFSYMDESGSIINRLVCLPASCRMNDAKSDAAGRFWAGSTAMDFAPERGALHVLDTDGTVHTVLSGLTLPNGLGWSPAGDTFYLVDSEQRWLRAWEFDVATGHIIAERTLVSFAERSGVPDGMCVDAEGALWVAIWGGSRLERYSAEGQLLSTIRLPVAQPSSCAFGGENLSTLFVTSAYRGLERGQQAVDGSLLAIAFPDAKGLPGATFRG